MERKKYDNKRNSQSGKHITRHSGSLLNHRGNVAEDVRQRIEKVICETGYVAKSHLKKDGKKSTYEVAVVFAKKNDSSYDDVLHGRELALAGEYRYSGIVLKNYPISIFNEREIRKALDSLSKKNETAYHLSYRK